jgi:hypothetical protein
MEKQKNLINFLIGLHNKPSGCGAFVASATGPFNKKIKNFILKFGYKLRERLDLKQRDGLTDS